MLDAGWAFRQRESFRLFSLPVNRGFVVYFCLEGFGESPPFLILNSGVFPEGRFEWGSFIRLRRSAWPERTVWTHDAFATNGGSISSMATQVGRPSEVAAEGRWAFADFVDET